MKRSELKRKSKLSAGTKPLRAHRQNPVSAREREQRDAWASNLGPCMICPAEGAECAGPVQGHHAIDKRALKRRGLHRYLWDLRNRVPVCEWRHEQHTTRVKPIPRGLLPASVFEFAAELGLSWWVDRFYPVQSEGVAA